ncbi:oxidoreductase [Rathayibacter iranicus]|uniref:Oxidoreductase n=2 Tax=Rathayibacter iranicus TaxID=59737 RepID=A0AAD1ACK1_9MICO|nr:oxidoreductase [Rathayibacter iranicus]AZZ55742.1 oxidoreductase [Rathayibacter iranicus]MWV32109.1 oxidoreductase [Rathayibacter iranicus NCPPB 2253 = VKM Ac-1602]PPI47701.1 oxidoreductase [Rathayibacter iranicus]PPI60613.1 oxidoreductase [Rathayibacter iranicus]PPI73195.1 oxidoreductase [Rathayibacter iranicus]
MIGTLDRALGRVTTYRLVWMTLAALLIVTIGYAAAGLVSSTPLEIVASSAVAVGSTALVSAGLARIFRRRAHLESSLVTGLLIACLLFPTADPSGLAIIALVGAIAAASKYVLAWRGRHLFNPAAIAVLIIGVTGLNAGAWWIASGVIWPWVVLGSLLVVARVRRWAVFAVFVLVAGGVSVQQAVQHGQDPGPALAQVVTTYPLVFAGAFMLTEPLTLAPRRSQQVIVAVVAALLASVPFRFGVFSATPELGLVVGNALAFVFAFRQRRHLALELTATRTLAPGIAEYRFRTRSPLHFEAGQWLEFDLPHRADRRGSRRTFSVSSAPGDNEITIALRMPERASSFKRALAALEPGGTIRATSVGGDFVLPADPSVPLLLVAGGIGITPFASHLRSLANGQGRDVVVVVAAPSLEHVAYRDLLQESGARVVLFASEAPTKLPTGWSHVSGRLTGALLADAVPDAGRRVGYVSGSPSFVDSVRGALRNAGAKRIRTDAFAGY